jgi:lactate dehydrogenase-like 2-hydroxyacid dehydrogenase
VLTETTADLTFALILAAARRLTEGVDVVRRGEWTTWHPGFLLGTDVHGATLGIVGMGKIGKAVARRADGFGMRVLASHHVGGTPLDTLLRESDFVSLHVPLTDDTRGLIGERELRLMKPTAVLVNTARGPVVDSNALRGALEEGTIGGAALDVTDPEPLPADHPLLAAPNLTVLPHVGSATVATRERMGDMAVENLLAGLGGRPMPHCANAAGLGG